MKKINKKIKSKRFPITKYLKITFIYFILFTAIASLIDYYALMEFNFLWFAAVCIFLAVITGYIHIKNKKHDHIDDVADELL